MQVGVLFAPNDAWTVVDPAWVELSAITGVSVLDWKLDRGRANEFEQTGTGTATVSLLDTSGVLDPTNSGGTFFGKLDPMKQVAIVLRNPTGAGSQGTVFRGFAESWQVAIDVTERWATVELALVDAYDILAASVLRPGPSGDPTPPGAEGNVFYEDANPVRTRMLSILADVGDAGWPADLAEIFTGNVSVGETTYSPDTSALAALQDAADAEFPGVANLYVNRQGTVTFHGRFARFNPDDANYRISQWKVGDMSAFGADSNTAVISSLSFGRDKETIKNSVLITPQSAIGTQTADLLKEDASSIGTFGVRPFPSPNLIVSGGVTVGTGDPISVCGTYGQYYLDNMARPYTRINQIGMTTPNASHPTAARIFTVLSQVDLGDIFRVTTTHHGGGGFAAEDFYIEGIHMEASASGTTYHHVEATFDLSPRANYGTATFGTA